VGHLLPRAQGSMSRLHRAMSGALWQLLLLRMWILAVASGVLTGSVSRNDVTMVLLTGEQH
jgi:hypothetical protein